MTPETNQSARMGRVIRLICSMQDAAGVDPKEQRLSTLLIECLYELPDDKLQVLEGILNAHAQLEASMLSLDDVARQLRVKRKEIRQLAKCGAIEGRKMRGVWLFTKEDVEAFIARNTFMGSVRYNALREPAA